QVVCFTCNLSDLAALVSDSRLAGGQKNGYVFSLQNCTSETTGATVSKFQVTASPITANTRANAHFARMNRMSSGWTERGLLKAAWITARRWSNWIGGIFAAGTAVLFTTGWVEC